VHSLQLRKVHGEEKSIVERNTKNTKWNVDSDLRHGERNDEVPLVIVVYFHFKKYLPV